MKAQKFFLHKYFHTSCAPSLLLVILSLFIYNNCKTRSNEHLYKDCVLGLFTVRNMCKRSEFTYLMWLTQRDSVLKILTTLILPWIRFPSANNEWIVIIHHENLDNFVFHTDLKNTSRWQIGWRVVYTGSKMAKFINQSVEYLFLLFVFLANLSLVSCDKYAKQSSNVLFQ